jgi:hypothetical protein
MRVADAIYGRPQYVFVRISGPSDGGDTAARDLVEFAGEIAGSIRSAVDGIHDRQEASAAAPRTPFLHSNR